jgi:hypothetical protein
LCEFAEIAFATDGVHAEKWMLRKRKIVSRFQVGQCEVVPSVKRGKDETREFVGGKGGSCVLSDMKEYENETVVAASADGSRRISS